jgi:hypothetical protein
MQLTSTEFIIYYLKYLTKWNKSTSLLSVIESYELQLLAASLCTPRTNHPSHDKDLLKTITEIAVFEHRDTQTMTSDKVLSIEEVMAELRRKNRDKKLNDIFK